MKGKENLQWTDPQYQMLHGLANRLNEETGRTGTTAAGPTIFVVPSNEKGEVVWHHHHYDEAALRREQRLDLLIWLCVWFLIGAALYVPFGLGLRF